MCMCGTKTYCVYILASPTGTLYVGVTGRIRQRVWQHQNHLVEGFTHKYGVGRLLYLETFSDVHSAIAREKQIKAWRREKKVRLIDSCNPEWRDLSAEL
jgi:putative endonuclease